jgi:1,4-dihydroxy-2-naphthoate octaprenyltransferase
MASLTDSASASDSATEPNAVLAWATAARPKTLPAAVGPVLIGGGLAWSDARFAALPFACALACAVLIQIGTNFANDYSDHMRGADTPDRLGMPRATQTGLIAPERMRLGAILTFGLAVLLGFYLVYVGGWPILAIGLFSIAAGVAYTGGPWPFGYHGLGDVFVFLFFGLLAVGGTYYVQAHEWAPGTLLAGTGVGALTTAILVVNNLRDVGTDARVGKRTMAVVLGRRGSQIEYTLLFAIGAIVPAIGVWVFDWPVGCLLALVGLSSGLGALREVWMFRDPRALNTALGVTARAAGLYGLLFAVGCLL